ncbi:MAG: hypothetical protein APF76_10890 [Desulfitibacter sp. BRH_c19]|nr:MAG: hypothetical protein APF76_10890 [Desulfitibacter sp. BRH_c19]
MKIGVPKEIKNNENRVAITPAGVETLTRNMYTIYVETNAGTGKNAAKVAVGMGARVTAMDISAAICLALLQEHRQ